MHAVIDDYCPHIGVPVAMHQFICDPGHLSRRLVPCHLSVDGRANRASNPVLVALEAVEARFMKKVGAWQADNVLI